MPWQYEQATGYLIDPTGTRLFPAGYAGNGVWKNRPDAQDVKDHGPLPQGWYTVGQPYHNPKTGPYTLDLIPDPANQMFGRDAFRIHGDSIEEPGSASDGCIVQGPENRTEIGESSDKRLQVVSGIQVVTDVELGL